MSKKVLMKGNEAISEGALAAGCRHYYGYPITPQNEISAYMAKRMTEVDGVFLQAESEVSAISMLYGASGAGVRVITSSSSPGMSLKQEGISYLAGANLPCVIVNIMRAGPGLGNITPSQGDYYQSTRGGGHGDYRLICLAPYSVQEMFDYTKLAFELSDKYCVPAMIVTDGMVGQMMEAIEIKDYIKPEDLPKKEWAITGAKNRKRNIIRSLWLYPLDGVEQNNLRLQKKYSEIEKNEVLFDEYKTDDAEFIFTAIGIAARLCKASVDELRKQGIKAGLFRPITIWPYPYKQLEKYRERKDVKFFMDIELNAGQMLEDVKLGVNGRKPVHFFGRLGGYVPTIDDIINETKKHL